jgi:hypothetical protein
VTTHSWVCGPGSLVVPTPPQSLENSERPLIKGSFSRSFRALAACLRMLLNRSVKRILTHAGALNLDHGVEFLGCDKLSQELRQSLKLFLSLGSHFVGSCRVMG